MGVSVMVNVVIDTSLIKTLYMSKYETIFEIIEIKSLEMEFRKNTNNIVNISPNFRDI